MPLAELRRKWRPACAAGATLALASILAACAGTEGDNADLVNGKRLFVGEGTCGSCHALKRAGTRGTQGPDLDQAFINSREKGFGDSVIEGVVHEQIRYPRRGSTMPADLVKGDDARDVAAYVAEVAGKPGKDTGLLASVGGVNNANKVATVKGGKLNIPADPSGALAYEFGKATAKPGKVTFESPNPSPIQHNIALEGPVQAKGPVVGTDGNSTFTVTLKKGKYTFLCTVPGHAEGGMKGPLTVQ